MTLQLSILPTSPGPLSFTRSFQLRVPPGTDRVVVDTPAALHPHEFNEHVRDADAVLVPVMPSDADIHACSRTIGHLLIAGKIKRRENRLAVIANRVKPNTIIFRTLMRFLDQMRRSGQPPGADVSMLKIKGTEIQQSLTELRMQAVGPMAQPFRPINAVPDEAAAFDHFTAGLAPRYCNFRKTTIYAGSNEIQRNIISKMTLGL